jgi:hypothetical protein
MRLLESNMLAWPRFDFGYLDRLVRISHRLSAATAEMRAVTIALGRFRDGNR